MKAIIPKLRLAADVAATKLIEAVMSDDGVNGDFESWLMNLPEYDAFVAILHRLDDAVTDDVKPDDVEVPR